MSSPARFFVLLLAAGEVGERGAEHDVGQRRLRQRSASRVFLPAALAQVVVASGAGVADLGDGGVQRVVQLAVAADVEPVRDLVAAADVDRRRSWETIL